MGPPSHLRAQQAHRHHGQKMIDSKDGMKQPGKDTPIGSGVEKYGEQVKTKKSIGKHDPFPFAILNFWTRKGPIRSAATNSLPIS